MSSAKVVALPGCSAHQATPNAPLVDGLRELLARAEAGELQSFIGTGFTVDGQRTALWGDFHTNVYEMRGAIAGLDSEYVERHTADE